MLIGIDFPIINDIMNEVRGKGREVENDSERGVIVVRNLNSGVVELNKL